MARLNHVKKMVPKYPLLSLFLFVGYTSAWVGFDSSPSGPYLIETSLDLPHSCLEQQGWGDFFHLFKLYRFLSMHDDTVDCIRYIQAAVSHKKPLTGRPVDIPVGFFQGLERNFVANGKIWRSGPWRSLSPDTLRDSDP